VIRQKHDWWRARAAFVSTPEPLMAQRTFDRFDPLPRMSHMLEMLRDLVAHKGHANAALLTAIRQNPTAASDRELWDLLHHILLANRFWMLAVLGLPFVHDDEARPSSSFDALMQRYAGTHTQETAWLETATEDDLARILEDTLIPNGTCSVSQAFMQVCLHSHGHRAQCAKLLRQHGGVPPATDFILWLTSRPQAEWVSAV
jgi:uncharacterized damage-inducible protein DinB